MEGLIPYLYRAFMRYRKRESHRNPPSSEMGNGKFAKDDKYYYYVRLQEELEMMDEQNHVSQHCLSWKQCKERKLSMREDEKLCTDSTMLIPSTRTS